MLVVLQQNQGNRPRLQLSYIKSQQPLRSVFMTESLHQSLTSPAAVKTIISGSKTDGDYSRSGRSGPWSGRCFPGVRPGPLLPVERITYQDIFKSVLIGWCSNIGKFSTQISTISTTYISYCFQRVISYFIQLFCHWPQTCQVIILLQKKSDINNGRKL